ncbi:retention module-containing protein, partial [Shewanella sp. YIC-542]|uniref:retention module-containing protein n=1 Tax=Shewanella mytili TaxID=3377111 RepID=UPI00398F880E
MNTVITQQDSQIINVNGQIAVVINGEQRLVKEGEFIPKGAELILNENASANLIQPDGNTIAVNGVEQTDEVATAATATDAEIQQLQALIAAGEDPTAALPETAAGTELANNGNSGYVSVSRDGAEVLASSGYDTASFTTDTTNTPDTIQVIPRLTLPASTVTLDAPAEVSEGGSITYTASVDNAPQTDLVLTLSNGASITIAAGQTSGTVTVDAPTDDVYLDGETLTVNVTGSAGGNYEELDLGNSVDTTVNDTLDTTTVTLDAPADVSEGGSITYTATVDNAPQQTDLVLTLSNGASITIAAGQTSGTVTVDAPTDDVYLDGETLTVSITDAQGGNYENLDSSDTASTQVNDTLDTTTVTLDAPADVSEGGSITYTATVDNAPQQTDLVLTLSNGASITIAAGQTSGTVTVDAPTDDVYLDGETLTVSITNAQGGNYEKLDTSDTASTLVNDTTDTVFAQISVDKSSVTEGGEITYTVTVTLVDASGNSVTLPSGASVSVSLDWSGSASAADVDTLPPSVTISGDSQQSFTVNTINDGIYENSENLNVTISGVTDVDNSLEQLEISANNSASTTILDAQDAPIVTSIIGDTVVEGAANTFTVNLSNTASSDTTQTLTLAGNTATKGVDFSDTEVTVTINGT